MAPSPRYILATAGSCFLMRWMGNISSHLAGIGVFRLRGTLDVCDIAANTLRISNKVISPFNFIIRERWNLYMVFGIYPCP